MSYSNGRLPPPEVIVNFADGFAYSKYKLEEAFRAGGLFDGPAAKSPAAAAAAAAAISNSSSGISKGDNISLKKEDIDIIIHEFEIPRIQAEKVLIENGGNLDKALRALVMG